MEWPYARYSLVLRSCSASEVGVVLLFRIQDFTSLSSSMQVSMCPRSEVHDWTGEGEKKVWVGLSLVFCAARHKCGSILR